MSQWKLFEGDIPHVSTAEFHADRERAPHLEQPVHRPRLDKALDMVMDAVDRLPGLLPVGVTDLGCGDGGLLQLLKGKERVFAWGYDFAPANVVGWKEREVNAYSADIFNRVLTSWAEDGSIFRFGDVIVCTEVLEHLANPHGVLKWLQPSSRYLIASSPHTETDVSHDGCHAWAWDVIGYRQMIEDAGWKVLRHEAVDMFQVVLAQS